MSSTPGQFLSYLCNFYVFFNVLNPLALFMRLFISHLQGCCFIFSKNNTLNHIARTGIDRMCNITVLTIRSFAARHSDEQPLLPSITLMSWTTNSLSSVMETMAFILPSFSILLTLTSVICINQTPLPSVLYNVNLSFFSMTIFKLSGVPICVVLARIVSLLSTIQFSITVLSPIYTSFNIIEFLITQLFPT